MRPEELGQYYESILDKEVRKEGGIYYTPEYIVNYIVENTVGKLLEDKTPKEAAKIKIVDPACGGGVFLLGAYQYLLDWHEKHIGKLTLANRHKILVDNIFGVDIDPLAVEITKYCLSMKCTNGKDCFLDLAENIRVGNALIDTDFYDMYPDNGEATVIKPFNWRRAFPDASKQEGFDCVIGNPPWEVTLGKDDKVKNHATLEKFNLYCRNKYQSVQGEINLYKIFTERDIKLVKEKGYVGLIMPTSLLNDQSNAKLRQFIASKFIRLEVNQFPERARVFSQITQDVSIYIFANDLPHRRIFLRTNLLKPEDLGKKFAVLPFDILIKMGKIPLIKNKSEINILKKLNSLCTFCETGFIKFLEGEIHLTKFSEAICAKAKAGTCQLIRGDAVRRYFFGMSSKDSFIKEKIVHTLSCSPKLQDVGQKRLVYQQVVNIQKKRRLNFQLLTEKIYVANTCGYVLNVSNIYDTRFILGLLNSRILNWRYKLTSSNNHILTNELYQLPFPPLDLSQKEDKQVHDKIVHGVDQLLRLYEEKETVMIPTSSYTIEDKIAHFENRIDELVYRLYGLSDAEIAIIEGEG